MKVKFYGTRGSIAVPGEEYSQIGGNTACVLVTFNDGRIGILDAGTGIRKLGNDMLKLGYEQFDNIYIGLTHTHWDHIEGIRFFKPAYDPRRHFAIVTSGYGRSPHELMDALSVQMQQYYFPVPFEKMGANFNFLQIEKISSMSTNHIKSDALKLNHPVNTYSYRIENDGKILVYCTDVEHIDRIDPDVVAFAKDAALLIHDAQYTPEELKEKRGWGHSSWEQAIEVAEQAKVKRLALFHHDPDHADDFLLEIEAECQKRFPQAFLAREGMEIIL